MAKTFKSFTEAEEALKSTKEERKVAKEEFKTFRKDNSLKIDNPPTDEKLLKKFNKHKTAVEKKDAEVESIEGWMKENKPKKERKERDTKYTYPDGATSAEKKKIRASERAAKIRAEKEANGDTKKKKKKKDDDKTAKKEVVAEAKEAKKKKKKKKTSDAPKEEAAPEKTDD